MSLDKLSDEGLAMPKELIKSLWVSYSYGQVSFEDKNLEREFYKWALGAQELMNTDENGLAVIREVLATLDADLKAKQSEITYPSMKDTFAEQHKTQGEVEGLNRAIKTIKSLVDKDGRWNWYGEKGES